VTPPAVKPVLARPTCQLCGDRDSEVEGRTTLGGGWACLCAACWALIGQAGTEARLVNVAGTVRLPAAAQVRAYLASQKWVYARTMPKWPHEYVLLKRATDPWLHLRVVAYVRQRGEHRYFAPSRRVHSYWQAGDGWEYWTMRAADTILNRARLPG
jgi:hypothetical protein